MPNASNSSSSKKSIQKRWKEVPVNWREIDEEIENAGHGMKTAQKKIIAKRLGLSLDQIHSALRSLNGPAKVIAKRKVQDTEAHERNRRIAYLVAEHKEKLKKEGEGEREMATWRVLKQFKNWGVEDAELCNQSTINRIIREELGYRQATPRTRHEPAYALQEVQVDFSFSKYFTVVNFDSEIGDYILKASKKVLRYKEGDKRMRPMLGVIIDSYSRLRFHKVIMASGESGSNTTAFMIDFFNREEDELVFKHVPWMFKMDNGPLAKSQEGKNFFQSINRPVETSMPYEKTGIGKAERGWPLIWQWEMELVSAIGANGLMTLSDYNSQLLAECVRQQSENHPFYLDKRRVDMYQQSILAQNPRPEVVGTDLRDSVYTVLERTVGTDQIVRIGKVAYQVPVQAGDHATTDRRIRVLIHRDGRMMGELIDRHAPMFEITEFVPNVHGMYSTHAQTFPQQLSKQIKEGNAITDQLRKLANNQPSSVIRPSSSPKRLMPASEELEVITPFSSEAGQSQALVTCSSKFAALTLVANLLKQQGMELNDEMVDYFGDFALQVELNTISIKNEALRFIQIMNESNTGTHGTN